MAIKNIMHKIVQHPDKQDIISKLVLNVSEKEISKWLEEKYQTVNDSNLLISAISLKKFKNEYLDLYNNIQKDAIQLYNASQGVVTTNTDPNALVNSNSAYRQLLQEYVEKEVDIKDMLKGSMAVMQSRIEQIYNIIQTNPNNTKPDYVLIQWITQLNGLMRDMDSIINGSPDKIIQQNNINIQILDQHIHVFHKVFSEVISRLDYETSLLFIDIFNEEMRKIQPVSNTQVPVDVRLSEARKLENNINQLDIPSS